MANNKTMVTLPDPLKNALAFIEVVSFDEEKKRIRLAFDAREEFVHGGGVIQGGFITGWIDLTMAFLIHKESNYSLTPLSLELKISFLEATLPGKVFAEAWIVRKGRSIGFVEGHLLNESGKVLATGSSTVKLFTPK